MKVDVTILPQKIVLWMSIIPIVILFSIDSKAQTEMNDYSRLGQAAIGTTTATDYQAIGINPANLGFIPTEITFRHSSPMEAGLARRKRGWSVTLGEIGMAIHSNAMGSSDLLDAVFSFNARQFSLQDKYEAARKFSGKSVYMNADAIVLGIAYQSDAYGGFAFTIRDRVSGEFTFNSAAANLAFLGRNFSYFDSSYTTPWNGQIVGVSRTPKRFSQLFDSTRLSMSWTREFNIGYGRRVYNGQENKLYLGFTFRYILGYAYLDSYTDPTTKTLEGYSSITPLFNINYGKARSPSSVSGTGMVPVGYGIGADFGVTYHLGYKWRVAASVMDIGKMYWTGNVYRAQDTILNGMSSSGFNSYNLFLEAQKITGDGGYFKWEGMTSIESALPTRIRFGTSYSLGTLRDVGLDMIIPVTNSKTPNLSSVLVSVGTNYQILPWLYGSGGMTFGGTMGYNIPLGVMFSIFGGFWEMGISTRDVLTFFLEKNPTASLTAGVCRLRF